MAPLVRGAAAGVAEEGQSDPLQTMLQSDGTDRHSLGECVFLVVSTPAYNRRKPVSATQRSRRFIERLQISQGDYQQYAHSGIICYMLIEGLSVKCL